MTDGSTQPPGWYYAQGDPVGTQRYWNGVQWQGEPQPVAGAAGASTTVGLGGVRYAQHGPRFIAFVIDAAPPFVLNLVGGIIGSEFISLLISLIVLAYWVYNYIYLQGTTGQTLGKQQQGIKLVSREGNQPLGMLMVFVRGLVSGIMTMLCLLDPLSIFFDENRQRLSDKLLGNHVIEA